MAKKEVGIKDRFQKRPGIYKMTNSITNDFYIGSTVNVYRRYYTHKAMLQKLSHDNSRIREHSIKHGPGAFSFEVIDYCAREQLLDLEQHYCDKLKPTYNVWPTVYSPAGRTYTEEEKKKWFSPRPIRDLESFRLIHRLKWAERKQDPNYKEKYLKNLDKTGFKHSSETKKNMSLQRKGKPKSEATRQKMREARLGTKFDPVNKIWIRPNGGAL